MDALAALDSTSSAIPTSAGPNAFSQLSSEEFISIIFTELTNQDPLKPNDTSALLDQMSMLRSIQSDIDLSSRLESIVSQNQLATAGGLIGKLVSGLSEANERVAGLVVSVSRTSSGPVLNLDGGQRVAFDGVDEMLDPAIFADPDAEDSGDGR